MHRTPVSSRMLVSVGYDPATNVLELEFHDGEVYQYFAVPRSVADALAAAESPGRFVATSVKPHYAARQVGGLPRGGVRRRETPRTGPQRAVTRVQPTR